ncbi:MAG: Crp/Fnr family transcriptional regulator [Desulfuromonadales bacterium]|nr:Crp/Fnr family transcriptional regulator [Desulfuromonadales bacterium]MDW7758057.1 Crp/Fnr family transcriptional regulator [Desulfuromonadales bacterium]
MHLVVNVPLCYYPPAMDIDAILKKCPIFAGVTDEDLSCLQQVGKVRQHAKGEVLFADGEPALGFYVLLSGKVKIYKLSPEGKERILHIIHPGGTFAEAAIFGNGLYPAYAEPLQASQVIFFPKKEFLTLLHEHSRIAINMIAGLSRFLRQFTTQIEELTFKDVPARLARYLLEVAGDEDSRIELEISKTQLASNLGTVSETLSRTLRKLSDDELIAVNGKVIDILDRDRLEDLAQTYKE